MIELRFSRFQYIRLVIVLSALMLFGFSRVWGAEFVGQSTRVNYEKFLRLNQPQNKTKNSDWLQIGHLYQFRGQSALEGKFQGDLRFYINNQNIAPSLSEAYLRYHRTQENQFTLGRQKLDWHPNEGFWQLDHFQGSRGFRLMDAAQEGLTGLHFQNRSDNLKVEFFLSYFYIPNLNPSVKVENGKVSSNSDWYKLPPERTETINGIQKEVYYQLNTPDLQNIVIKKSLGARGSFDWGQSLYRGEISGFAIYKPERRLRVNADARYEPDLGKVVVTANPLVNHHLLYGGDIRQRWENSLTTLGFITVDPNSKLGEDFDTLSLSLNSDENQVSSEYFAIEPQYEKEAYLHYSTLFKFPFFKISTNYIHYLTKHDKGSDDFYGETVKWKSAGGLGLSYNVTDWFQTIASLRYDFIRADNLLSARAVFTPTNYTVFTLGTEFIRSPRNDSYWSSYRANDTFFFNAGYIF